MSEDQGYIRVVNVMVDRTNRILGNRHVMKTKSRLERERVIEAFRTDLEADIATGGPMSQALMDMAKDIAINHAKIGCGCWCSPADCHGDVIAEKVREIVVVLAEDKASLLAAVPSASAHKVSIRP